ncbi:hypothetical protein LTR56_022885 [Elasticomyces elasticus]|nr:hypothetical protein LTR56_022885 [Elasticomyces elasticus]KAK3627193.1 hypothetical protein LTR22_022843 [Elasticomyces elasticus]KAK4928502.1 hypothetical protein LTR49_004909 [Elasticomyces elasticus]KAK5753610.1 hypothetical protein LTS12_016346 [Elasticomyces elasticus]
MADKNPYRLSWALDVPAASRDVPEASQSSTKSTGTSSKTSIDDDSHRSSADDRWSSASPYFEKPLPPLRMVFEDTFHSIAESALPPPLAPRRPSRTFRNSINRLSLTPSDMPYPAGLLRVNGTMDLTKAEQMLGLEKKLPPRPAAKVYCFELDTSEVLPKYTQEIKQEELEPLNGRTAWLHSLMGALIVFNCWGITNAFGLFQAFFETSYLKGTSPSNISWIGSTQLALVFGLGVPVGRLVDKGYFRLVFHSGSVIMLIGIFCTAWCKTLWSLWLVQGLITGLGMGMVFCAAIVAMMTWFDERKLGAAMGVGAAGSCVGGIVYVLVARQLLPTHGFPFTMRILGAISAAALIPPNLTYRVRGQHHRAKLRQQHNTTSKFDIRSFLSPAYLLAMAGFAMTFLGLYFGFVYIISFASTQLHLSNTAATNLLIYMLAANLPGRFLPGIISDKCIGPLNTIIPSVFLSAGCMALWMALGENDGNVRGALTVVACFYGFVSAGIQVLYAPTVYAFCLEPVPKDQEGGGTDRQATQLATERMGLKAGAIFTAIGLACLVGTPIGGALIKYRVDRGLDRPYLGAQVFAMGSLLLGGFLLLASRVSKIGWQAKRA